MFVFLNPCASAELHQQKRARKLCSAALIHTFVLTLKYCVRLTLVDQLTMAKRLTRKVKVSQGVTSGTKTLRGLPSPGGHYWV